MKNVFKRTPNLPAVLCSVLLIPAVLLSGCTGDSEEEKNRKYIAVICKGTQHEFWKTAEQGARDAGKELDVSISFEAPNNESEIDVQIKLMENAIKNKADAIALAPLDTEKLNPVIDKAAAAGIPVLTFDSDVTSPHRSATLGTNNINAGSIAARNAAEMIGGHGEVAIISYVKGAQTAIERNKGFVDTINKSYKDKIKIVGTAFSGGDADTAKQQALDFIKKYPDLKCIYAANEGSAVGAAMAVEEQKLKDQIQIIGFDSSDAEIAYLNDGTIDGMMVQNPYNMGYLSVRNACKLLNNKTIESKIDTGITYVNRENVNDEDTQWLLYPLGTKK